MLWSFAYHLVGDAEEGDGGGGGRKGEGGGVMVEEGLSPAVKDARVTPRQK